MPEERRWSDADRELVVSVMWTRALQGGNAGVGLELQPAGDAPLHYWADAAALLDALTADGWVRMDPAEPHLIQFRPDGWTIQHPLRCRPNLFACEVNRVAGQQIDGQPATGLGVYECDVEDGVFVLDYSSRRGNA